MKKSYSSIRLVRVGKAGETQFERGSIEDTVRRISRGDNLKLDSLGQTLLSVLHTDLPPLPTKPVRRLSSKISVPVKSGHWRPKQRPSAPGSSFQDLLSHITTGTGREKALPEERELPAGLCCSKELSGDDVPAGVERRIFSVPPGTKDSGIRVRESAVSSRENCSGEPDHLFHKGCLEQAAIEQAT